MNEIREENILKVNNNPLTNWDKPDNTGISDELSPKDQDSNYARSKRGGKISTALSLFAISGATLLTGASLLSSFIKEPTLSEVSLVPSQNQISLSLKISNPQGLKVLSSLFEYGEGQIKLEKDSSLKEETEMTFKGDKVFSYVYENVDFQKENVIRISFTNNIDYTKIIFEQTVTFIS